MYMANQKSVTLQRISLWYFVWHCNWVVVLQLGSCFIGTGGSSRECPPRVKLKDVFANVDNAPDGDDYVTTVIKNDAKLMVYAGKFDTSFKL